MYAKKNPYDFLQWTVYNTIYSMVTTCSKLNQAQVTL